MLTAIFKLLSVAIPTVLGGWVMFKVFFEKSSQPDVTTTAFKQFFTDLPVIPQEILEILTYDEVIKYFSQQASTPELTNSKRGIVFRQVASEGNHYHIGMAFLDKNNQVILNKNVKPYGRQLTTKKLDDELKEIFGNKDYFIVT